MEGATGQGAWRRGKEKTFNSCSICILKVSGDSFPVPVRCSFVLRLCCISSLYFLLISLSFAFACAFSIANIMPDCDFII